MKITMSGKDFNRIMRSCKNCVSREDPRWSLQMIELRAANSECVATALDGFSMMQVTVPCDGEGLFQIRPQATVKKDADVEIEYEDECISVTVDDVTTLRRQEKFPEVNWGKVVAQATEKPIRYQIAFNAKLLRRALAAIEASESNPACLIEFRDSIDPAIIRGVGGVAMALPIRINGAGMSFVNWAERKEFDEIESTEMDVR